MPRSRPLPWEAVHPQADWYRPAASRAFECTIAAGEPKVLSDQGVIIGSQVSWKEAHERLSDFDVLVVLGGNVEAIIKEKAEPLELINAFSELQKADPARERTLLSICTGSLMLANQGILAGLSATTHPDYIIKFENLCSQAAVRDLGERTDVVEDARYVVNNLRFDIGDEDENPYIRRKSDAGRRPSNARYAPPLLTSPSLVVSSPLTRRLQKGIHLVQCLQQPPRIHRPSRGDASRWSSCHHEWGSGCRH